MRQFQASAFDKGDQAAHAPDTQTPHSNRSFLARIMRRIFNPFARRSDEEPSADDDNEQVSEEVSRRSMILGAMREAAMTTGSIPEALQHELVRDHWNEIEVLDDLSNEASEHFELLLDELRERVILPVPPKAPLVFSPSRAS